MLFNREIATLISQKCVQCHATGKLAMPLETFEQVRPWAQAIKEEVLARQMPPWSAQRGFGAFANDISLTNRELGFLISWIDGGTPEGDGPAPVHMDHGAHWMMGTPDRLLTAPRPVIIEPQASPQVRRIVIDAQVRHETWLRGFDYKPSGGGVVRAAFVSVDGTDQFIGGWTPWATSTQFASGTAFRLSPGARLAIDVLYQSAAERAIDQPQIGLYFSDSPIRQVRTLTIGRGQSSRVLAADSELLSVRINAPADARSVELRARRPDGRIIPLLRVRELHQDWQMPFVFSEPMRLAKGTAVQALVRYVDGTTARARSTTISINSQPAAR